MSALRRYLEAWLLIPKKRKKTIFFFLLIHGICSRKVHIYRIVSEAGFSVAFCCLAQHRVLSSHISPRKSRMGKRLADITVTPKKSTRQKTSVPRVADMENFFKGSPSTTVASPDAHLLLGIFPHCTNGNVYSTIFGQEPLDLLLMESVQLYPNPIFLMKRTMQKYVNQEIKTEETEDIAIDDYLYTLGSSFVYVDKKKNTDPDDIGYVGKQSGFYVRRSSLKDLIMFLDEVLKFRLTFTDGEMDHLGALPHIHLHISDTISVSIDATKDEMHCPLTIVTEVPENFSVFSLPPPVFPSRNVILTIDMVTAEEIHMIFGGNTKPFQEGFATKKIKLNKTGDDFFRVVQNVNLKNMKAATEFLEEIYEECLKCVPLVIRKIEDEANASLSLENVKVLLKDLARKTNVRVEF